MSRKHHCTFWSPCQVPHIRLHEGQEVEVSNLPVFGDQWRKAKIVLAPSLKYPKEQQRYQVQFPDGTRAVFDAEHIRYARTCAEDHT